MRVTMSRAWAVSCALALLGCSTSVYGPRLYAPADPPDSVGARDIGLKVHLMSGDLVVLTVWQRSDSGLAGPGERFNLQRQSLGTGEFFLPFDSIALLETRERIGSRPTAKGGMIFWSVVWGLTTVVCVADPKSCFGSCPTFYVATDSGERLVAEGFSASIARALEAKDLDALFPAPPAGMGPLTLRMRNEALETHAVRSLTLHVAPRPPEGRVFAARDGTLYPATVARAPSSCQAADGDCEPALRAPDGAERTSLADSTDLAARETLELTFPAATGRLGVVIAARQSLLTTYLFYQTMGYLGGRAGETLAALERGGPLVAGRAMGMSRLIAPIEVEVEDGGGWRPIGVHDEAGPLATQVEVVPFTRRSDGPVRVRLSATRGAWRLDWVALADLGDPVQAVAVSPEAVRRDGRPDSAALALLRDPERYLVTYPGDTYDIVFRLPAGTGPSELLLESQGFYYEWMRAEWLADEDPGLALLALTDPAAALRALAPGYKRAEPKMESLFWSSRFAR